MTGEWFKINYRGLKKLSDERYEELVKSQGIQKAESFKRLIENQVTTPPLDRKCISDRCLDYLNNIKNKFFEEYQISLSDKLWIQVDELYKDLRVDGFISDHNPKSIAGGIVYFLARPLVLKKLNKGPYNQRDIADVLGTTEASIRGGEKAIRGHLIYKNDMKYNLRPIIKKNSYVTVLAGKTKRIDGHLSCKICNYIEKEKPWDNYYQRMFNHIKDKHEPLLEKPFNPKPLTEMEERFSTIITYYKQNNWEKIHQLLAEEVK